LGRFRDHATDDEKVLYAYTANVMNDTHMSHAMEFPYPQSMANCVTCHEGKLDVVLTDDNFTLETCKSCHPVTGSEEYGTAELALATILPHSIEMGECSNCHTSGGLAAPFSEIHTGYDKQIYTAAGVRYADIFTTSVDAATWDGTTYTFTASVSATEAIADATTLTVDDISTRIYVAFYGYDTHDFLGSVNERNIVPTTPGVWDATFVLDADDQALIDAGAIKRVEIAIRPALRDPAEVINDGDTLALNAASRTFVLATDSFDDTFYKGANAITDVAKCNECHDALATTFHSPDRGGSVVVCNICHYPGNDGSHLEMQSRGTGSYVHAIHSFQAFDIGDVNFVDPVEAVRYDLHVEHTMPLFTIKNCEACHNEGTNSVPDQSKSLPGWASDADEVTTWDRNIGAVPSYVTGPASRACGSCHRADLINEDEAGELVSFNQHTKNGGYLIEVEVEEEDEEAEDVLARVIDYIMALFN